MWQRLGRAIRDNPITALMSVLGSFLAFFYQLHQYRKECPDQQPLAQCIRDVVLLPSSAKTEYEREVENADSEERIESFIRKYKDGPYVTRAQARQRVARAWTLIKNTNDPHTLFAFLSTYHDPIFEKLAQASLVRLDDRAWQLAASAGARDAITRYVNVWSAFNGQHLQDAQFKLNELDDDEAWRVASREDSPEAYRQYLNHPWARHGGQAQRRYNELSENSWQIACAADTIESYRTFLTRFPDTQHQEEALSRIRDSGNAQECDHLAANPNDPAKIVAGIRFGEIEPERAIAACEVAAAHFPKNPRFKYQLARAYQSGSQSRLALPILEELVRQKYIAAYDNLGWVYLENKTVSVDVKKAIALFKVGAAANQPEPMTSLGVVYQHQQNFAEAKYWYEKAASFGYADAKERLENLQEASPSDLALPFTQFFRELTRKARR